jgi:calcineurin-like phosphoesterase family protein
LKSAGPQGFGGSSPSASVFYQGYDMPNVFLISDTHFGHANIYKFLNGDGTRVRHQFEDVEAGDSAMIENWNRVVGPKDKVYHLGDVFINRKARFILEALNGNKVLIKGNHDIFKLADYTPFFRDIRAYHVLDKIILSHVPIHRESIGRFRGNVHGHLHANVVNDILYKSVCVERINYTPIEFSEIQKYYDTRV